ncbi:hypothetical protein Cjcuy013_04485 [Campylobacter jejuni]|nr:hypothetical protein [Campylobacter jejuni]MBC5860941.1 hypothetical protein [Campylobacter jejuni]
MKNSILLKKLANKIILPKSEDLVRGILDNVDFDSYRLQLDKTQDIILQGNRESKPSLQMVQAKVLKLN